MIFLFLIEMMREILLFVDDFRKIEPESLFDDCSLI